MTRRWQEQDRIKSWGGYHGTETRLLVAAFLKNPGQIQGWWHGHRGRALISILLRTKCLLRERRLSFSAGTVPVGWRST